MTTQAIQERLDAIDELLKRGWDGPSQEWYTSLIALRQDAALLLVERTRIQTDFADDLADRNGDLYEQIKELVGHSTILQARLAAYDKETP